jgi:hypothetical protein
MLSGGYQFFLLNNILSNPKIIPTRKFQRYHFNSLLEYSAHLVHFYVRMVEF